MNLKVNMLSVRSQAKITVCTVSVTVIQNSRKCNLWQKADGKRVRKNRRGRDYGGRRIKFWGKYVHYFNCTDGFLGMCIHQTLSNFVFSLCVVYCIQFYIKLFKKKRKNWTTKNQFCDCCSVSQSCPTLYHPIECSTPGFSVLHHLLDLAQTHVNWISDAIQPSHPLSSPSLLPSIFPKIRVLSNESAYQVAKVLKLQLQCPWMFRIDFL